MCQAQGPFRRRRRRKEQQSEQQSTRRDFHAFWLSQPRCASSNPNFSCPSLILHPKLPTLYARISIRQLKTKRMKKIFTDIHRFRNASTGNLWSLSMQNQPRMAVQTLCHLPAVPYHLWGKVVVVAENRQKPPAYISSKISSPKTICTRF